MCLPSWSNTHPSSHENYVHLTPHPALRDPHGFIHTAGQALAAVRHKKGPVWTAWSPPSLRCQAAPDWGSRLSPISCAGLPGRLAPKSTASPAKELELSSSSLQPGCGLGIINSIMQTARWTSMPNWGPLPLSQQGWPWKEPLRDEAGPAERPCPSLGFSGTPPSSSHPGRHLPVLLEISVKKGKSTQTSSTFFFLVMVSTVWKCSGVRSGVRS